MPLSAGDQLGPYVVTAPIGAGGMGEVYKARDTRLDRTVAIKVLPEHIAKREDLRARFEREARAVASLNHPNICTLYDIGNQEGVGGFMVMELIEGESLAARIEEGAIPLDQALQFATQIADALDRAHRAGVTHRDVKPQNIMLARDGVKVLDFGLAKSQAKPGPSDETLTAVLTTAGTILGTPQYMAPEQFAGKEADARSDIWAFGAVLYEMVTGRKAFHGSNYQSLVGAILAMDPAPMAMKPFTPAWLERLVRRCLAKDPENRCQTMRDLVIELKSPPAEVAPVAAKAGWWPWVAGVATLALLVSGVLLYNATRPAPPRPLINFKVEIDPDKQIDAQGLGNRFALSPDGARLAITLSGADGRVNLYTRLLNQSQVTLLAGTENAASPFFSPTGDWIAFFADGKLKKVAAEGGAPITLCEILSNRGGSWGDDGNIITTLGGGTGLSRIPSSGGTPVPITKLSPGEATHRWPHVLPGSHAMLFTASSGRGGYEDANIDVISFKTGERKTVARGGFSPRYLPSGNGAGHLVYLRKSTLFALPFNPTSLTTSGAPTPIMEDVSSNTNGGGYFAFANNGTFAYATGAALEAGWQISWLDSSDKTQSLHAPIGRYFYLRFSPDGRRLAFSIQNNTSGMDIWVKDLDRDTPSRLSFVPGSNQSPVWTPDGKTIVFVSFGTASGLYAIRADGSGEAKRLTDGNPLLVPSSFSPDGKRLAVTRQDSSEDLLTLPVEVDTAQGSTGIRLGKAELFLGTPFREIAPAFSPDGRWLAYRSDESGLQEIYVRPFPGPGGRWQVSTGGGSSPAWSRDGRELLFQAPDGHLMSVPYTAKGDSFIAGKPRRWSATRVQRQRFARSFDPAPDGKRLAAISVHDQPAGKQNAQLIFLLNFFDELRRKAPAER